ncbi:ribose transport system ATP-binding protein [Thermomonospora echinospora]|uniref:Ribose transport system ATP-binding protein n=1 Tax=Thermomonospora echinospora TaxID=1992 RepID=A0A1H6E2N5_9ACTN|nr:ATP-binding cassette domain-containing protein [Thermomonospora echinospora]SEG91882.1 ribose transport system ATP-binding protein [Thermomonospora echinospora]
MVIATLAPDAPGDLMIDIVDVRKRFGATQALRGVTCSFSRGEFVALLGSNGAGKSTLVKILDGVYPADAGTIAVRGGRAGLGVVHQDLGLVDGMTVAENLCLGAPRRLVNPRAEARLTTEALRAVGLTSIDPYALVSTLSLGQRAMVAVAKTLHRGADTVVIDEVTAGLHPHEARWVVERLRVAAEFGATVLMVTHKLDEVVGAATRYVVLSDGEVALDEDAGGIARADLVAMMSRGRSVSAPAPGAGRVDASGGGIVCELKGVHAGGAGPIDLTVTEGRITAITGPLGSGLHEVAYAAAGLLTPDAGTVRVASDVRRACVPAHRESEGVFAEHTVQFNVAVGGWSRWRGRTGLLRVRQMRRDCDDAVAALAVVPHRLDATVSDLSGGNQQKTLFARALMRRPRLLVLCEPTRGVDVATRREIYAQVRRMADSGTGVLMASTDYEDIAALADTTGVLTADGTVSEWLTPDRLPELTTELA